MSKHNRHFFINGEWIEPNGVTPWDVINPATEEVSGTISLGRSEHVDMAVAAARAAFKSWSETSVPERVGYLKKIVDGYKARMPELARTITAEMGSPIGFSNHFQAPMAIGHMEEILRVLETYEFEQRRGTTLIRREPVGVAGLITAWNWPLNLVISKLSPALGAGCTVVVKPSEFAPLSTILLAEIIAEARLPAGVFNLVNGDGPTVGAAISSHPDIDMVSVTGSTRAGVLIAKAAADGVKRVTQELGGKSANIILPSAPLAKVVGEGVFGAFINAGQACQAPTRMLVHRSQRDEAVEIARRAAERFILGDPLDPKTTMGPLAHRAQYDKVRGLIDEGINERATLVVGGSGRPAGFDRGYYVRPTIFADATVDMRIAKEEIFGPVLTMMNYEDEAHAIEIANATEYGLASYVQAGTLEEARKVGAKMRAGRVYLNGAAVDRSMPFGGYKKSGNGREWGVFGLEEYLEVKAVLGYEAA
jgi:aldehyde dehydrogenase (NAD+)